MKEAARLIRSATYQALTDPFTGRIDFEQLHVGVSEAARTRQHKLGEIIIEYLRKNKDGATKEQLNDYLTEQLVCISKHEPHSMCVCTHMRVFTHTLMVTHIHTLFVCRTFCKSQVWVGVN